jgi:hypothetical protein
MNRRNYAIIVTVDQVYKWIHWVAEAVISLLDFGDRFSDVSFAFQLSVLSLCTLLLLRRRRATVPSNRIKNLSEHTNLGRLNIFSLQSVGIDRKDE